MGEGVREEGGGEKEGGGEEGGGEKEGGREREGRRKGKIWSMRKGGRKWRRYPCNHTCS